MTTLRIGGGSIDVEVDGESISSVGSTTSSAVPATLDAGGCTVLPGFVDVQVNGAVGVDLSTEPERVGDVAAYLTTCGVTSFMPTVISSTPGATAEAIEALEGWRRRSAPTDGARSLGVHLEGPFLNPDRSGAHPRSNVRPPSRAEAATWSHDTGVAMVTLAPELQGAIDLIDDLVERGVVVCAGHTDADACALAAAVAVGLSGATHLFNAMGSLSARHPGASGALLDRRDVICGLIVDGLHVDPAMVRVAWRLLGPERVALVTDSMAALGLPFGDYVIGETPVIVGADGARTSDGTLAGSVLRFDEAVRKLIAFTGCSLAEASTAASTTPAALAQRSDIGRLAPRASADIVLLDRDLQVVATVVGGSVVFDPEERLSWKS